MDLAKSDCCWVEIRPLITSKLETANFTPILDSLHLLSAPFRFLITTATTKDNKTGDERRLVRFFLQFQDEPTKNQMTNIIKTLLDVEVIGETNPLNQQQQYQGGYGFCLDLELAKNYALPIVVGVSSQHQAFAVNLVDRLVASMSGLDLCVEVIAQADPNAGEGVQKFVYEKLSSKSASSLGGGVGGAFLDSFVDLIGTGAGKNPKNESYTSKGQSGQNKGDAWSRELVKNAELKLSSNLFTCKIRVFGNSLHNVLVVKNALPAAPINKFKTFKITKKPKQQLSTTLKKPSRYTWRNNVLCRLWWIVPLSILLGAWFFGLFNPLKLVSAPSISVVDVGVIVLMLSLTVCLFIAFRKRNAVVLSTHELTQITGLPTAIEKLPIALGKVPLSRMQLGTQHPVEEKEEQSASRELIRPTNNPHHPHHAKPHKSNRHHHQA